MSTKLKSLKDLLDRFKRGPSDMVGIDLGVTATNVVRMQKGQNGVSLLAADILPATLQPGEAEEAPSPPALPSPAKARYAALCTPGDTAVVKLLSLPGRFDERAQLKVVESLGIKDPATFRIGYKLIAEGHGKAESRVLAVAMPEDLAVAATAPFATGLPAPYAVEISGLASMAAFLHGPGQSHAQECVGCMDFGPRTTTLALFNQESLALVRRFTFGADVVMDRVGKALGVDRETVEGVLADGSFDISQPLTEVMEPFVKQLVVSRDFVERRENCRVSKLYATGSVAMSHYAMDGLSTSVGLEIDLWNPFEGLTVARGAVPEGLAGQEWRFASAVGACLGTFEET